MCKHNKLSAVFFYVNFTFWSNKPKFCPIECITKLVFIRFDIHQGSRHIHLKIEINHMIPKLKRFRLIVEWILSIPLLDMLIDIIIRYCRELIFLKHKSWQQKLREILFFIFKFIISNNKYNFSISISYQYGCIFYVCFLRISSLMNRFHFFKK